LPSTGGDVIAAARGDGSLNERFEVAQGKAHGAISIGIGSRAIMARAEQQPHFIAAVGRVVGPLVLVPGGVPIVDADGRALGAVEVSGDTSGPQPRPRPLRYCGHRRRHQVS
jgi:uncharacterized protein GlcG (DUF336 family)